MVKNLTLVSYLFPVLFNWSIKIVTSERAMCKLLRNFFRDIEKFPCLIKLKLKNVDTKFFTGNL